MPEVFPYSPTFTLTHTLKREFVTNEFGDGYVQIMSSEVAYSRADGTGSSSAHKGLHVFDVNFNNVQKTRANNIWTFLLARINLYNEAFYFYNPEERLTPDLTGADVVGRYLVRLDDPNQVLSRSYQRSCIWGYNTIRLIEERA